MEVEEAPLSGDVYVDSLAYNRWVGSGLTFSFPTGATQFTGYTAGEPFDNFEALNGVQQAAVRTIFAAISNFTNLVFTEQSGADASSAVLRFGMTDDTPTAHAYLPSTSELGGDSWYRNTAAWYDDPVVGNYAWLTFEHEIGHMLGLIHPFDSDPPMPTDRDSMSFTVMSYQSYSTSAEPIGYTNEEWGFAQTYMVEDVAALQFLYGANFNFRNTDTVYSWSPTTGEMFVNGVGQGAPGANRVFETLWDGGGNDTYDFSNYAGSASSTTWIDLRPGSTSGFSPDQNVTLGPGNWAGGVTNAQLYNGDLRSLIENAIGTNGDDRIEGNEVANVLTGGGGSDTIYGEDGNDTLYGNDGMDFLYGGAGDDTLDGGAGNNMLYGGDGNDTLLSNATATGSSDLLYGEDGDDVLRAGSFGALLDGGAGNDTLWGGPGNDNIQGGDGNDFLFAGGGLDWLNGGAGDDALYVGAGLTADGAVYGGDGNDQAALQGDYSGGLTLGGNNVFNVDVLVLLPGNDTRFGDVAGNHYSYNLTAVDANVAAGQQMVVNWNTLRTGENVTFNGSAETNGTFLTYAAKGIDHVTGGHLDDGFYFGVGNWGSGDSIDGQGGTQDQLGLQGNYSGASAIVFGATQLSGIEAIVCLSGGDTRFGVPAGSGYSYDLTMNNGDVAAGQTMYINANKLLAAGGTLTSDETLTFNGSAETDGHFIVFSGAGADTIVGGGLDDQLWGGGGADAVTGGLGADSLHGAAGNDAFLYTATNESTAASMDQILDFTSGDHINLSAIDAISGTGGTNDAFHFIGSAAFSHTAGELQAVLQSGTWFVNGDTNGDGTADLVIAVTSDHTLAGTDFVM